MINFNGKQTANQIITECPLYRLPNDLYGLIDVNAVAATREWLLAQQVHKDLFFFFWLLSFTRKKKKKTI